MEMKITEDHMRALREADACYTPEVGDDIEEVLSRTPQVDLIWVEDNIPELVAVVERDGKGPLWTRSGYGDGDGYDYGYSYGHGYGDGDGHGYGHGYGSGYGYGHGDGHGYGAELDPDQEVEG